MFDARVCVCVCVCVSTLCLQFEVTTTMQDLNGDPQFRLLGLPEHNLVDFQLRAMGPYFKRPEGQPDERCVCGCVWVCVCVRLSVCLLPLSLFSV